MDLLGLVENRVGDRFRSWSAVCSIELDAEVSVWASRVVAGGEDNASKAAAFSMGLVQIPDHRGNGRRR